MRQELLAPASGKTKNKQTNKTHPKSKTTKNQNFRSLSPKSTVELSHAQQPRRGPGPPCTPRAWWWKSRGWFWHKLGSVISWRAWGRAAFLCHCKLCWWLPEAFVTGSFKRQAHKLCKAMAEIQTLGRQFYPSLQTQQSFPILSREHVRDDFLQLLTPPSAVSGLRNENFLQLHQRVFISN